MEVYGRYVRSFLSHARAGVGRHSPESVTTSGRQTRASAYPITAVPFSAVRLSDEFWTARLETNRTVTIPFGFRKSEEEGRLRNFDHAAGHTTGRDAVSQSSTRGCHLTSVTERG